MPAVTFWRHAGTRLQVGRGGSVKVLGHPLGSEVYCRHHFATVAANTEEAVVAIKRKCPPPPRCALLHHWLASPMIIARGNAWGNAWGNAGEIGLSGTVLLYR